MAQDKERLFDLRTLERNIEKGLITREEYEEHVAGLEDKEDNADTISAEFERGVLDDDDEVEGEDEEDEEDEKDQEEEENDDDE
jgi:hypothetical protein